MGNDMRGNIAAASLIIGVATAVFVTAASETGSLPLEDKVKASSSASPEPSKSDKGVVNSTTMPSQSISIEPAAAVVCNSGIKKYARCKLKQKFRYWKTQFGCLDKLNNKESRWKTKARNPYSGAYGIPQALPGNKMRSAGSDWKTNPRTQIRWQLEKYIYKRYKTPCAALKHSRNYGWY